MRRLPGGSRAVCTDGGRQVARGVSRPRRLQPAAGVLGRQRRVPPSQPAEPCRDEHGPALQTLVGDCHLIIFVLRLLDLVRVLVVVSGAIFVLLFTVLRVLRAERAEE